MEVVRKHTGGELVYINTITGEPIHKVETDWFGTGSNHPEPFIEFKVLDNKIVNDATIVIITRDNTRTDFKVILSDEGTIVLKKKSE